MNVVDVIGFLFGKLFKLFPILVIVWLASVIIAVCCLAKEEWHYKARWYLCWALFPFPFLFHPKRFGFLKSWLLFFVSPCMISVYYAVLMFGAIILSMGYTSSGVPTIIPYHTAEDLKKVTGVEFPEIIPIDSTYEDGYSLSKTTIKFVPKQPLALKDFKRLDKACKDDSCCWSKDSIGYVYYIYPERPIDRTSGTHIRQVEVDGRKVNDWDGDFIEVRIPSKGDTIYLSEGWCM